jgi:hypothetical protein
MQRHALVVALTLVAIAVAACGSGGKPLVDTAVRVAPDAPPSPATWPPYPRFPDATCWARAIGGGVMRAAPSTPVSPHHHRLASPVIVERLLRRLGDRRYVRRIEIASPPPITLAHLRGYFAGVRPPRNAQWAYVAAPVGTRAIPARALASGAQMVAEWETSLVVGALRDDVCRSGRAPLVGWTIGRGGIGLSDRSQAFEQRFPSPSPAAFRRRVVLVGRRYGFTVEELRLLRPRQLAPLLVVHTRRDRKAFVADVPRIMRLLDPISQGRGVAAITFEGFFFEARDDDGPFVRVENVYRGQVEGGQWSWNRCVYPYVHSQPFSSQPCP